MPAAKPLTVVTPPLSTYQNVNLWQSELLAAGWKATRIRTIWKAPSGALYLGPFGAWKAMKAGAQ